MTEHRITDEEYDQIIEAMNAEEERHHIECLAIAKKKREYGQVMK